VKHSIIGDPIYGMENDFIDKYLKGLLTIKERIKSRSSTCIPKPTFRTGFVFVGKISK
jgi:hypothetical protein